ncbi:hypothetical protein [Pedobacter africanus]|uniref:Uncharacterized protein n=1 Tax=Pedobacter africanus TaxID=151894 RepID=A0ACC6KU02_9SPHI|nr:hypothetical protein [Pedobacter africanus]MDR6782657.1 hypothetical protein [Pedobacter africanus]
MEPNLNLRLNLLDNYSLSTKFPLSIWSRLLWLVAGDELIFIHSGSEFETQQFSGAGWALEFNQLFVVGFVERYPDVYNNALMTTRIRNVSISLSAKLRTDMNDLAILLRHAQEKEQSELYLQAYADLILLNANQAYAKQKGRLDL